MKELFVPYKLALLAKQKGFDEPCFAIYDGKENFQYVFSDNIGCDEPVCNSESAIEEFVTIPLYQQLIDFFREKYHIHVAASSFPIYKSYYGYQYGKENMTGGWIPGYKEHGNTYYEALNKAFIEAFKLIQ